jgi:hypothetical protein
VITRTNIDATHLMSTCDEGIREPRKEGGRGTLQEKDDAFGLSMHANDEATPRRRAANGNRARGHARELAGNGRGRIRYRA